MAMSAFFVYILQSSVCLAVLFLFYSILLSRETFYRYNRVVLLVLIPLSFLLPLCHVPLFTESENVAASTAVVLDNLSVLNYVIDEAETPAAPVPIALVAAIVIYWAGVTFFIVRYIVTIVRLLRLMKIGRRVTDDKGQQIIVLPRSIAPFSWFDRIVLSEADYATHNREILLHESAHIHKRHSFDLLAADLCSWLQWFNPAAWLLKRELQTVHEYEADAEVLDQGIDARQYQLLLIKRSVGSKFYCVTNHFNHNKLNKRITMMLKKKSSRKATWKYLYVIPVALCTITVFARPEISNRLDKIASTDLMAMLSETDKHAEEKPSTQTDTKQIAITVPNDSNPTNGLNIHISQNGKPLSMDSALYIIDDKKISYEELGKLPADQIKSVTVLKGEAAVEIYGDEAQGGAVLISTKKSDRKPTSDKAKTTGVLLIDMNEPDSLAQNRSQITITDSKNWNIDIDDDSLQKYKAIGITAGKEISFEELSTILSGPLPQRIKVLSDSIKKEVDAYKNGKTLSSEARERIDALSAQIRANADSISRALEEKGVNALLAKAIAKAAPQMVYTRQIPAIIYVIDGKKASEREFNKLLPDHIASIRVLKGREAKEQYGTKDNDKVLIITTKKKK